MLSANANANASATKSNRGKWLSDAYIVCDANIIDWPEILKYGMYRPATLETEKFIHCAMPRQLADVANKYFHGEHRIVWVIDPKLVSSPIKYEGKPNGELYPHIYGPLNLDAIIATFDMQPEADGSYQVPEEFLSPEKTAATHHRPNF